MLGLRDFLDHLAWYWVVARQSQALRLRDERDEKLRTIAVTRSEEFLLRLFELEGEISSGQAAALTYFAHLSALRVKRAEFGLTLGRKFTDHDFSNLFAGRRRPFYDRVRDFVDEPHYAEWRGKPIAVEKHNRLPSFLGRYLSPESSFITPPFFQTLLQWNEKPGVTWLAFRDLSRDDAKAFPTWSQKRLNAIIATHDEHPHLRADRLIWLSLVDGVDASLNGPAFGAVIRDLFLPSAAKDEWTLPQPVFDLPPPVRVSVVTDNFSPSLDGARCTVIATSRKYGEVVEYLPAPTLDHAYAIFDIESTKDHLSKLPWLWSQHLGPEELRILAPRDWDGLLAALTSEAPPTDPFHVKASPVDRIASLNPGATVAVHGRLGTGKTICLYQMARQFRPDDLLIVVKPKAATAHRLWLDELLREWRGHITCLFDDLDEDDEGWLSWLLRMRGRAEKDGDSSIAILTAYAQEETHSVGARFWRELQDFDRFSVHDSDVLMSVGVRATRTKAFRQARERMDDVWGVRAWSPSLRQLLHAIPDLNREDFAWPAKRGWLPCLPEQQQFWTAKFRRLVNDPEARDLFALLVLVRVFYWVDAFFVSDSRNGRAILESAFSSLVTNDGTRFHAAWAALQDDWLMPDEAAGIAYVDLQGAQVLDSYLRPTPIVRDFLAWMINGGGHWQWREIILDRLSQRIPDVTDKGSLRMSLLHAYIDQLKHRRAADPSTWNGAIDETALRIAEDRLLDRNQREDTDRSDSG